MELIQSEDPINVNLKHLLDLASIFDFLHLQIQHQILVFEHFLRSLSVQSLPLQLLPDRAQLLRQRRVHRSIINGTVLFVGGAQERDVDAFLRYWLGLDNWSGADWSCWRVHRLERRPTTFWPENSVSGKWMLQRLHFRGLFCFSITLSTRFDSSIDAHLSKRDKKKKKERWGRHTACLNLKIYRR